MKRNRMIEIISAVIVDVGLLFVILRDRLDMSFLDRLPVWLVIIAGILFVAAFCYCAMLLFIEYLCESMMSYGEGGRFYDGE